MWHFSKQFRKTEGFTLLEVMVSITVVVVILAIVLSNQSSYTDGASVRNAADTVSLAVSQAQSYGLSVHETGAGTNEFSYAFGLEFRLPSVGGANNEYIFFVDKVTVNSRYSSGWSCPTTNPTECLEKVTFTGGNTISSICSISDSGAESCNLGGVDIAFIRPNVDAIITYFDSGGSVISSSNLIGTKIKLTSPKSVTRSVVVYKTGQVSVQ